MVLFTRLLPITAGLICSAAAAIQETARVVPGAYIVELADDHDVTAFYNNLGSSKVHVKQRMKLEYSLFKGTSFQLNNLTTAETTAEQIANLSMVKRMWPVRVYSVPKDEVVWKGSDKNIADAALRRRRAPNGNDTFSPHVMTQVNQLRAEGVTGEGIRIAVIDTGVDYDHPALGGCFGDGCLVSYGTDLVGDNYTGFNTPVPDDDPDDQCEGHGSHVAGIIAAQTNGFGFTGAAPGVTLGAYRVFGCGGSAGNDVLIAAYNQAYDDGSDIITASIGGASGWSEDPWAVAVQRIVEAGVPCTVSAGNDGEAGIFYASTAANGKRVTAIASVDNTESPLFLLNGTYSTANSPSADSFGWTPGAPDNWGNVSLPLWAVNYDTTDPANGCDPYPADTPNLSGYIVLIRRGTCTFVQKATNAAAFGAKRILFYNNIAGVISISAPVDGILGVGTVTAEQGAEWISLLSTNTTVIVNIIDPDSAPTYLDSETNTLTGGFLSDYTSWGPTWEVDVKPQLAAPGGNILSTYPLELGGYAVLSGTSMACPLAAAVFALIGEVRGSLDPAELENLLSATSNPNLFNDGTATYPFLAPVAQQGSGLIQAYDAAYSTTLLSVSSLSFNDTDHFAGTLNFTIDNLGSEDVTYSLANVVAATAYTLDPNSIFPSLFPNELVPTAGADLAFSSDKVTVPADSSAIITVTVSPPAGLAASRLPVYSGYITLNSTSGESLSLPYLGVVGSLHNATVLDTAGTYLSQSSDPALNPVPANTTFTLPATNGSDANTTYPAVVIDLALGSRLVRADVIPQSANSSSPKEVLGVQTLGNIFGFPQTYVPRGQAGSSWDGRLADGSLVPAGTYSILVRALKLFGDETKEDEFEAAETVVFGIKYS
ncbi:serine endopeptidase [Lophiostoma macrostomum CBS 122681]|uniref:Serine endopeptidase n=1 Tax=Lophiostoma macrostomum CBS 122681 TaxID=1314788 RepID=A0A6A6SZM8_9PLEO|nr:serine endopeptidase [Lophiostoma macrostomum CBS 122681]